MKLKLYDREEIIKMGKEGWYILPCKDEKEPFTLEDKIKEKGYKYFFGHVITRSGVDVPFVLVKGKIDSANIGKNKIMRIKRDGKGRPKKIQTQEPIITQTKRRGRPKKEVK